MDEREKEISLYDMLLYICQRWRALLIWLVVGAVVLGVYGWYKSDKDVVTVDTDWTTILTASEIEDVEAGYEYWKEFQELNNKQPSENQEETLIQENEWGVLVDKIDARTKLKSYINGFSEEQTKYFELLKIRENNTTSLVTVKRSVSIKYILLGAVLGLIIAAVVIAVKYAVTKTVKTVDDLENGYGFQILGVFDADNEFDKKHKTRFDKAIKRARNKNKKKLSLEENLALTATKIQLAAEKANIKNICVVMNIEDENGIIEKLINKFDDKLKTVIIKNILAKADALQNMSEMEGAILLEQLELSVDKDIHDECMLCIKYGINIIGTIILN